MAKKTKEKPKVELNSYQMSKTLKASKISSVEKSRDGNAVLVIVPEEKDSQKIDPLRVEVDRHFVNKFTPRSGGYLTAETVEDKTVYGFISAEVFESNYKLVDSK